MKSNISLYTLGAVGYWLCKSPHYWPQKMSTPAMSPSSEESHVKILKFKNKNIKSSLWPSLGTMIFPLLPSTWANSCPMCQPVTVVTECWIVSGPAPGAGCWAGLASSGFPSVTLLKWFFQELWSARSATSHSREVGRFLSALCQAVKHQVCQKIPLSWSGLHRVSQWQCHCHYRGFGL